MRIPIIDIDQYGIVPDRNPYDLPVNAWSGGRNIRFENGRAEKARGYENLLTPTVEAEFAIPVEAPAGYFWVYAGRNNVYAVKESAHSDITKVGGFTVPPGNLWTGGVLNGVPVLNHFGGLPQAWTSPDAGNRMSNLPNWPAAWRARSLRPYKVFLVALGVADQTGDNPYRVVWSHAADPGTVPDSWDITDPTKDAGDYIIADTDGALVDQLQLRDANVLYKTDSVYLMQHVGGIDIMGIRRFDKGSGLLMPNGLCEITQNGSWHIVFGPNDVYRHNGSNIESVFHKRIRNWIFKNIDSASYKNGFLAHNVAAKEVYVCFPLSGSDRANIAVVWNYLDDTTTIRELPRVNCAAVGRAIPDFVAIAEDTWANATGTWMEDTLTWGGTEYSPVTQRMIFFQAGAGAKALLQDQSNGFAGAPVKSVLERLGLNVLGQDLKGKPIYDSDAVKTLTEVWPRFKAPPGTELKISVGAQMTESDPIAWQGPFVFKAGQSRKVTPYLSGKILSIRFEIETLANWSLSGYDLEIVGGGGN